MTAVQRNIATYVHASAGNGYFVSSVVLQSLVGMLQAGEATEDDFRVALNNGDAWLSRMREEAEKKGWGSW